MTGLPQPRGQPAVIERQPLYYAVLNMPRGCKCGGLCEMGELVLFAGSGLIETCKRCARGWWPA